MNEIGIYKGRNIWYNRNMINNDIMQDIPDILESLSNVSSSNEKKRILEETKSEDLKYIFKQAYDPFINFGTVKVDVSGIKYDEKRKVDSKWYVELNKLLYKLEKRELTGNHARDEIRKFMERSPEKWADIVLKILKKDLRIGAGKSLINHVYKNLFPEDFCMAAMKIDKKRFSYPVYADIKLDGVRCVADVNITTKNINLFSRNGRLFKNYSLIADEVKQLNLPSLKLDGEITMGHFQNLMRTISRKEDGIELAKDAVYNIFDVIIEDMLFTERLKILRGIEKTIKDKNLKHLKVISGQKIDNEEALLDFYGAQLETGHEGIMVKPFNGTYEFKRTYSWQKMKPEQSEDLEILRVEPGTGKYAKILGAIICKLPDGNEVNCGSGFTDEEREEFWKKRNELIGQIAEIKYQEKTKDGSLRFPVFVKFRFDKL